MTTTFHAVLWIDHQNAQVLQFDDTHVEAHKVKAHTHHTAQHGSRVRTEHEFFASVCDALEGIGEVLAMGPRTGLDAFRHYVEKHRAALLPRIVDFQTADHPTDNQMVAEARRYFLKHDRMSGVPTPT